MPPRRKSFDLLAYLAHKPNGEGDEDRLPPLNELSKEVGVSTSSLREQLEVAKVLGLVEVRPRTGIRRLPYRFAPAVEESLSYAIAVDRSMFDAFADLRRHVEMAYWYQAVALLTKEDVTGLQTLIEQAWEKLRGNPIRIPHREHRALHLSIFKYLENPFVLGVLEAYWDAYEEVGLNRLTTYEYLENVWQYHQRMVEALCIGDFDVGYQALVEHMQLIHGRPEA